MALVKASDIANLIRTECGIAIAEENDGKVIFSKEELLLIVAALLSKRQKMEADYIQKAVHVTMKNLKMNEGELEQLSLFDSK
jgi:hypothetical protein